MFHVQPGRTSSGAPELAGRSRRPHIIGVSVSETMAETITETDSVTAELVEQPPDHSGHEQQRNERTAINDKVSETIVKPICAAPQKRCLDLCRMPASI